MAARPLVKTLGLLSLIALVAGCGSSGNNGPLQTASQWLASRASSNGKKLCELSTPAWRAEIVGAAKRLSTRKAWTCAAAATEILGSTLGEIKLSNGQHTHPRLVKRSGPTAEVQVGKGEATLKLERFGSKWLVASYVLSVGSGGLLQAAAEEEASSSVSYAREIKKDEQLTREQPQNPQLWEQLTTAQLHEAGGEEYVSSNGGLTHKGRKLFSETAKSWHHYLALRPPKPSVQLAKEMLRLFGEEGLNRPALAVQALQIVVAAERTNAAYYAVLAQYAYRAHNPRVGEAAATKAVELAPANQRVRLKVELEAIRKSHGPG